MKARVVTCRFELSQPYTIAYETISDAVNHFIAISASDGRTGVGCAAPAPEVTGESPETSRAALDAFVVALEAGNASGAADASALRRLLDGMPDSAPSARAAVDMALDDLEGTLTAGDRIERPISVTIGICGMDETTALARRHLDQGFSILKIKGGHDARTDVRRLRAVRELAGPDIEIALDANQGYSMADVSLLSDAQPELRLAYLEQPTPRDDHRMLVHASAVSAVPVMADETVRSVHDVQRLVELGGVGLVNVKLQKVGGAGAAARIDRVASEAGIPLMLGCMDESALSIAAALRFGAAHTNVRWYDLDGHLDLEGDPFAGLLTLRDGVLRLDDRSGIGASMHSDPMSPFG